MYITLNSISNVQVTLCSNFPVYSTYIIFLPYYLHKRALSHCMADCYTKKYKPKSCILAVLEFVLFLSLS